MSLQKNRQHWRVDRLEKFVQVRNQWIDLFKNGWLSTNRELIQRCIGMVWAKAGKRPPNYIWCDSPFQLLKYDLFDSTTNDLEIRKALHDSITSIVTTNGIKTYTAPFSTIFPNSNYETADEQFFRHVVAVGSLLIEHTNTWLNNPKIIIEAGAFHIDQILTREHDRHMTNKQRYMTEIDTAYAAGLGLWLPGITTVYLTPLPHWTVNSRSQLHNDRELCVRYPDGKGLWALEGVIVSKKTVLEPKNLTAQEIINERNIEARCIMIRRAGPEKLLSKAVVINDDYPKYGTLYRVDLPGSNDTRWVEKGWLINGQHRLYVDTFCFLKVRNSTPEPDGQYKDYYLRVPADCERAKQAVAWTFNIPENEYELFKET